MASGGIFTTENKVLPGAYINFVSKTRALGNIGERGIVAMPWYGSFGKSGEIIEISAEDFQKNCDKILGFNYSADEMLPLREVFLGASVVKLYRMGTGKKASATSGDLTITALYDGVRGNQITIVVSAEVDSDNFTVETFVDGVLKHSQSAENIQDLADNDFVSFSGQGKLVQNAGIVLSGGENPISAGQDYSEFLSAIESEDFTVVIYPGSDETTKKLFAQFTKRLRDEEGYKVTCVLRNYEADFEGVINVVNSCRAEGAVDENGLVYWVGGMTAGTQVNESLTNMLYNGELQIYADYKKSQLKEAIQQGKFVFYKDKDCFRVLKDINSFTSISSDKNKDFQNNQIIRVLDAVANDTAKIFNSYYLGKCQNNELGRDIFKTELVNYHQKLMALGAIEGFLAEDITVAQGEEKGDVIVKEYIEPVGAMDKIYMTCIVE